MGASGGIQLTAPTINGLGAMASNKTQETDPGNPTDDTYTFDYDFNAGDTFTLTGDFNFVGDVGVAFFDSSPATPPGFFIVNSSDGTFTYTVTAAEIAASSTSVNLSVFGAGINTATDEDTIILNFTLCFAKDTGIATPSGEQTVESLQIGDMVLTADGRSVPVKWIGRTTINPMFNPADRLDPVCIAKGALGPDTPTRDLILTAEHGMVLDDMVINAGALVGAPGIGWYPWKQIGKSLTYYHIETEAHDIILANGAPSETFLDMPDRRSFENFAEYEALYGTETPITEMPQQRISSNRLLPQSLRDRLGIPADDLEIMLLRA